MFLDFFLPFIFIVLMQDKTHGRFHRPINTFIALSLLYSYTDLWILVLISCLLHQAMHVLYEGGNHGSFVYLYIPRA